MRIAFWNINGNVGKSTITNMVMKSRLPEDAEVIYVESDNTIPGKIQGCKEFEAIKEDWAQLVEYLAANVVDHDIVVDIGSTDSKKVKALFVEFDGSLDEFDLIVVPHSPDGKQEDTALTVRFLSKLGVAKNKIKVVFSIIPTGSKPEKLFRDLFAEFEKEELCIVQSDAIISHTPLFGRIKGTEHTMESILSDKTDWQKEIIDATPKNDDPKVKEAITYFAWMKTNKMLATKLSSEFDSVFKKIMSK